MGKCRARYAQVTLASLAAAGLVALSVAPAAAAAPVAQASASAVTLTVAGQTTDSGAYQAVNDGSSQSTSGSRRPPVTVLGGQPLLSAGTLAQDATTSVSGGQGSSAACAGLAGQGATVASVGDAGSCLTPGQAVTLDAGTLDLGNLQIAQSDLLMGLDDQLTADLQPVIAPLTTALQTGLTQAVGQLGLAVDVGLGAVQSSCMAGPGSASGTSHLTGAGASVTVAGQPVNLVSLPVDPAPNTHVVTGLGDVAKAVETALDTQLATVVSHQLQLPVPGLPTPPVVSTADQATVLNNALSTIGTQLAPLQDNVLDITLNQQSQASADQITVTALDLKVLPAAQQLGVNAFELEVGTSSCGPSGRVAAASPTPTPSATPVVSKAKPRPKPKAVPTAVPAGLATTTPSGDRGRGWGGLLAVAGLLAVSVGAAGATWSGLRRPR